MDLSTLTHAPKKVYFIGAGIGGGFLLLKLWRGRASNNADTQTATDITPSATPGGLTYLPDTTYGGSVSPLISPVIQSSGGGDNLTGVPGLQDLYTNAVSGLIGNYENLFGPLYSTQQALLLNQSDALANIAQAGSSPAQAPQIIVTTAPPVQQPAPQAVAAPSYSAPAPAAKQCSGAYSNLNETNGKCYKVVCATGGGDHSKGRWHFYSDGSEVKVASTC